jgi:hypothetical protein
MAPLMDLSKSETIPEFPTSNKPNDNAQSERSYSVADEVIVGDYGSN